MKNPTSTVLNANDHRQLKWALEIATQEYAGDLAALLRACDAPTKGW